MSLIFKRASSILLKRACLVALGMGFSSMVFAQVSTLPPQVVTNDPALLSPQAEAEEDASVTISPDDRSTSVRTYGRGGQPSREVVDPPILPSYSEAPPAEPQSVIPDSDPVRGDMVQPPMWTLWSW
ncbi:MAG: hypothetical protein RL651_341 [Pseudomonadota bacterium]|jgi:hypothetical protein